MRLILFDVDGTLIDSQAVIHESMCLTFRRWGYPEPDVTHTRSIIGLTLDTAIATLLGREVDDEVAGMAADYRDIYIQLSSRPDMLSMPFAGIVQMIDRLSRRKDIMLGLVTGKSRRGVARMVANPGFRDRFVVARCADDCPSKPHPAMVLECCDEVDISPDRTMVIGDTSFDMEMARSARACAVGVSWGYHPVDRISSAGAARVASSVTALESVIGEWLHAREAVQTAHSPAFAAACPVWQYA